MELPKIQFLDTLMGSAAYIEQFRNSQIYPQIGGGYKKFDPAIKSLVKINCFFIVSTKTILELLSGIMPKALYTLHVRISGILNPKIIKTWNGSQFLDSLS